MSELKDIKALQSKILKQVLTPGEYKKLIKDYRVISGKHFSRGSFESPLLIVEKKILRLYLYHPEKTIADIAEEVGVTPSSAISRVRGVAIKVLYQNRDKINLKEILGEKVEEKGEEVIKDGQKKE
jgi:hypothetical protein